MGTQKKLSVSIATHNEAHNIKRCLASIVSFADEIVVVDGSSSDETVKIAKSFGKKVRVLEVENKAMFHINKQKALDAATGDWILQLDADEEVTNDLREEISQIINSKFEIQNSKSISNSKFRISNSTGDQPVAYWIPRLNYFLGKPLRKGGQYPDYTIRLYKRGVAKFPCKSIHEQVEITHQSSDSSQQVAYLTSPMNHFPYVSFTDYIIKWDRYCDLEAQALYDNKVKLSFWLFLQYFLIKPKIWFLQTYFRHKGFVDGFPGYIFSLFSSMRFMLIYIKFYEKTVK